MKIMVKLIEGSPFNFFLVTFSKSEIRDELI